jgi:hypothetical protein
MFRFFAISIALSFFISGCSSTGAKTSAPATTAAATSEASPTTTPTPAAKAAPAAATAPSTPSAPADSVVCTFSDVKRELRLLQKAEGCTVEYIKDGTTQEIANGAAGSNYCPEVLERVKNNLVAAGYSCK